VGTDFTYGDVLGHPVDEWTHKLIRNEVLDGVAAHVVESTARDAKIIANTKYGKITQELFLSRGFQSAVSPEMLIGFGELASLDSLTVIWANHQTQTLYKVKTNQTITIKQKEATETYLFEEYQPKQPIFKDVSEELALDFTHLENNFIEFNREPLIPHMVSSEGPALAVGDVNGDGKEDFFVGGAKHQSGLIFLQTNNGFKKTKPEVLALDSISEDVKAVFFDADQDKDLDLLVLSGGNEFSGKSEQMLPRLYLNDGKGNFKKDKKAFQEAFMTGGDVAIADFDKDGDIDLFVGGRVNARMYGYNPSSVLLVNDGKGNFTESTERLSTGLQFAGMVTSAAWSDIDGDGWQDLIIAGEWMPIIIFKNNKGHLDKQEQQGLQLSNGWWNCMNKADLDGDGDDDFLLGNWGTNSKLTATKEKPLSMYLADWDNNGDIDPLLCIYKNNNYYNFLGKADLEKRLPYLKKKYLQYSAIAGKSVEDLFTKEALDKAKKFVAYTMQSSILWNNKGQLSLQPLPGFLQVSPIFSFATCINPNGEKNYLAAGNFFDVQPYEGRYDAMLPTFFNINKDKLVNNKGYILEKGAVRNIQTIQIKNKQALLMGKNNDSLVLLSQQ
jgi:hypothetical protein